jgi:small-conductance mechanosensitive channel/CRP-like cAMP-binding protein
MTNDLTTAVSFHGLFDTLATDRFSPSEAAWRFLAVFVLYVAFAVAQRYLRRFRLLHVVALQLNLLVLDILILAILVPAFAGLRLPLANFCAAAALFLGITLGLRVLDVFFFDVLARWRKRPLVPLVVRDIGRWTVSLIVLVSIIRGFFPGLNLNVLAVSSLVVGYVVGNATQDTLGNLIAGLALNTERPFQIGDWVTFGEHTGVVVDTTWRATRLRTKADDYVVIPNASIAREPILNFSRPTQNHGCYLAIGVSYETPPNKARAAILGVLRELPDVLTDPAPSVYLVDYGNFSINFKVKFFIQDYARTDTIQSDVMDRLWYAFRREGISIPFPIQEERQYDAAAEERVRRSAEQDAIRRLLSGVDLFQTLSPAEFERLTAEARLEMFARGEQLCRQGEEGDTFYVIRTGQVAVSVSGPGGVQVSVAQLGDGAFFGEMSLLTGEKRSATVKAETDTEVLAVSKPAFAALLQADAALAEKLGAILEKRAAGRQATVATASAGSSLPAHSMMVTRIRKFFGLA